MEALLDQGGLMEEPRSDVAPAGATRADRAMERYAAGDDASFVELYDELAPRLYGFALRWTHSRSAAEDVVQQTLLQMHAARQRFVRGGAVAPWAYAIARRLLIDLGRRGGREVLRGDGVHDPQEPAAALAQDDALELRRMEAAAQRDLAALPAGWRDAFELVKFEGLSVAETAAVLGITRAMVKIRAHRATVALRAAVARRVQRHAGQGGFPT
jgi:RNA polymerase sigma-70 factor (ECF subfamily)